MISSIINLFKSKPGDKCGKCEHSSSCSRLSLVTRAVTDGIVEALGLDREVKLVDGIANVYYKAAPNIALDTKLIDLKIDELEIENVLMEIEDTLDLSFTIDITDDVLKDMTVNDLINFVTAEIERSCKISKVNT